MAKITCPECHGSGERCYFKGESRFVLSHDECPACAGLGFIEWDDETPPDRLSAEEPRPEDGPS